MRTWLGVSARSFPDSVFVSNSVWGLPFQVFLGDLPWGPVLKAGVPALRIVPEFDVPHDVPARVLTSRILGPVDALVLQCGEERFGHRIIVADPGAADGMPEVMLLQRPCELLGCVVAAAVGAANPLIGTRIILSNHLHP